MEYKVKEKTQTKIVLEVINTKDEIENAKKESYKKLIEKVRVPGFRVGKAPYEIGSAYIGESRLLEESIDVLLDKSIREILEKENIDPFTRPSVDVKEISNEKFIFEITVEFLPEVQIDLSEKIKIKETIEVKEDEINEKLDELKDTFTELLPKEGAIQEGDVVEVAYKIEGKGEEKTITVEVGKDKVIGDFNEKIIGKNQDDEFDVNTNNTFVRFKVVSVKSKKTPQLNDDFAKEVGADSLNDLKEKIRKEIFENKKLQAEESRGNKALDYLASKLDCELPSGYIEEATEERFKELDTEYLKRGLKLQNLLEKEGKTIDEFKKELKEDIIEELKKDLVIREIIKKYDIQATEDEIKEAFERLAKEENLDSSKISLTNELRNYLKNVILRTKALSILKENTIIEFGGD